MTDENATEVIEDPNTGLYMEFEPRGSRKDPGDDLPAAAKKPLDAADLATLDAETAKKAAKALDAGGSARPDAGKPKGASNALLFHQWDGKKKDD